MNVIKSIIVYLNRKTKNNIVWKKVKMPRSKYIPVTWNFDPKKKLGYVKKITTTKDGVYAIMNIDFKKIPRRYRDCIYRICGKIDKSHFINNVHILDRTTLYSVGCITKTHDVF